MSVIQTPITFTAVAGADLSAKQFHFVKVSAANQVNTCGDGEAGVGVLLNKPKSGEPALVQIGGLSKVVVGAGLTAGARVMSSSAGKALTATTGKNVLAVLTQTGTGDGSIVECVLSPVPHVVP
jgi:hypothetical protein